MDESTKSNQELSIKEESIDIVKHEIDSCSQDSSKSGNSGYQRWAPNLDGVRKSAFMPYKAVQCTALTNLQRGNTQARVPDLQQPEQCFHWRAGRGELTKEEVGVEAHVDVLDIHGLTGLHWAAAYGQVAATTHLLWCGADVNCKGPESETALHLAAAGGHHEIVKMLLDEGAAVNHQDEAGNTALMYAAAGDFPYTCHELLLKGADLTLNNECDQDAYGLTISNGCKLAQTVIENFLMSNLVKL